MKGKIFTFCRSCMSYIMLNYQSLLLGLIWVGLIAFFTYTPLLVEVTKVDGDFQNLFYYEQSKYISLFVNVGIVIMLIFDNVSAGKQHYGPSLHLSIFAIVLCLMTMAHCDLNINNELQNFIKPISCKELALYTHGLFLFLVYLLKVSTLTEETIKPIKEVSWKQ